MKQGKTLTSHFSLQCLFHAVKCLKVSIVIFLMLFSLSSLAQEKYEITEKDYSNTDVEMADVMRQNGKIYVVVGVVFIIFAGMTFYLVRLDRRVSAMEKELED